MPQITVEYSAEAKFDHRAFALALHKAASPIVKADVTAFKSRFRQIEESVIGDGSPAAMTHIRIGLLTGRSAEVKHELGRAILEIAEQHIGPVEGLAVQVTAEVYDMDRDHYYKLVV